MAREATITFEQVSTIADELKAKGVRPTSRAVREMLGTGSMGTVCTLMRQWQAAQPRQNQVTDDPIDPAITRAVNTHLTAKIQAATSDATARLADLQGDISALIQENERQAAEINDLTIDVARHKEERSRMAGQIEQLSADLTRTTSELEAERQAAEKARIQLAKAELRLEAVPRIEADIKNIRAELEAERKAAAAAREEAAELRGNIAILREKK